MADDTITIPPEAPPRSQYLAQPGEWQDYLGKMLTALPRAATQYVPGLVSAPLSSPEATGLEKFVPSAVSGAYNWLDRANAAIGQAVLGTKPEDQLHLPGAERAGELADSALKPGSVASMIPTAPAQDHTEAVLGDMFKSAGQMGVPAEAAMNMLPGAVKTAAGFVMPGLESASAAPIAAGITGAVDVATGQPHDDTITIPPEHVADTITIPPEGVAAPGDERHHPGCATRNDEGHQDVRPQEGTVPHLRFSDDRLPHHEVARQQARHPRQSRCHLGRANP